MVHGKKDADIHKYMHTRVVAVVSFDIYTDTRYTSLPANSLNVLVSGSFPTLFILSVSRLSLNVLCFSILFVCAVFEFSIHSVVIACGLKMYHSVV